MVNVTPEEDREKKAVRDLRHLRRQVLRLNIGRKTENMPCSRRREGRILDTEPDLNVNKNSSAPSEIVVLLKSTNQREVKKVRAGHLITYTRVRYGFKASFAQ